MTDKESPPTQPLAAPLTAREREILALVGQRRTNRQIAAELVLAHSTVRWYLRQIYAKLGVAGRSEAVARARELGLVPSPAASAHSTLPAAATPFLGREAELEALGEMVRDTHVRLVTILGPGGIGKTRLALALAERQIQHRVPGSDTLLFPDGVRYASLSALESLPHLVSAIATAVGLDLQAASQQGRPRQQQVIDFLRRKRLLLVLDNFEHLLHAAPFLAQMMAEARRLKVLVTSRQRLQLQGEHLFWIQGLALPEENGDDDAAARSPAVRLFANTAGRVRPSFHLDETTLVSVARTCRLLQGIPLAIELAASWAGVLSSPAIEREVRRGLDFLQAETRDLPARQRSMRAVFESTWERLGRQKQVVFAAVSVFRGGFTLQASRVVAGASPHQLRQLRERSLLATDQAGRFQMHELLRQFAAEQLARAPQREAAVHDAHSDYYLAFLAQREPELKGAAAETALAALAADAENVFAAWDRAVARKQFAGLGAAAFSLATFCDRSGRYEEGRDAFGRAVEPLREYVSRPAAADPAALSALIRLLAQQCLLHRETGALNRALAQGKEALSLLERPELEESDMRRERALVLSELGWVYIALDRAAVAERMLQESVSLFKAVGDTWELARAFFYLGGVGLKQAEFDQAGAYHRQAMQLFADLGDRRWQASAQMALGYGLNNTDEWEEAEQRLRNSIQVFQDLGEQVFAGMAVTMLAETIAYRGKFAEARELATEGMQANKRLGRKFWLAVSQSTYCYALLHLGGYEAVLSKIESPLEFAQASKSAQMMGRGQFLAGCAWLAQGRIGKARDELEEAANGLRKIGARDYLCEALVALSCTCTIAGKLPRAKETLLEATGIALDLESPLWTQPVLAAAAFLMKAREQPERAVTLYALAACHPFVASSRWFEDVAGRHIAAAAGSLAAEVAAAARARGEARHIWQTTDELLAELERLER